MFRKATFPDCPQGSKVHALPDSGEKGEWWRFGQLMDTEAHGEVACGGAPEPAAGSPCTMGTVHARFLNLHLPASKKSGELNGREWSNALTRSRKIRCMHGALDAARRGVSGTPIVIAGDFNMQHGQTYEFFQREQTSPASPTWDLFHAGVPDLDRPRSWDPRAIRDPKIPRFQIPPAAIRGAIRFCRKVRF